MIEQVIEHVEEDVATVELTEVEIDAVGGGYGQIRPF
jgi:hypothetical protein